MKFLRERMSRQGLVERAGSSVAEVASSALGLQAQDHASSRLGVRARTAAVDEAAVIRAGASERSVARTWLMRSTVHLVAADDVQWMSALFGPMIERRFGTVRWRELGITAEVIDAATRHARQVLAGRQLSRHEVAAQLADRGIALAADPQAATHLLLALSARGVTVRGPDVGRESTFVLMADWVGPGIAPDDPPAELARRYFRAFGPATAADFTTWSGLPSGAAMTAIRDELTEVEFDGRRGWSLGEVEPARGFRLLPMFDNYLLGYRDRNAMLAPALHAQVYVGGIIKATVVDDGRVIGIWRLVRGPRRRTIEVTPFEAFTRRHRTELERERADVERFLGAAVDVRLAGASS